MKNEIGGFKKEKIRKAYFNKKIPQFLSEFQSKCSDKNEIDELEKFLERLQYEESDLIKRFSKKLGKAILGVEESEALPLAKFLGEMGEEEKNNFVNWQRSCNKALSRVKEIIKTTRKSLYTKTTLKADDWIDSALEIATLMRWIDEDRVYKDQMYRKVLMETKKKNSCSRLEAEELTKTTQEYRDYKLATLFRDELEEFINLCKKKGNNY